MIEKGKNPLTEANLRLICLTFNVREKCLRFGEGDMFDLEGNDPLISKVVELMKKMSPEERQMVLNYVRWYVSQQEVLSGKGMSAGFPLESIRPLADRIPHA
jgi:hypothetical protein